MADGPGHRIGIAESRYRGRHLVAPRQAQGLTHSRAHAAIPLSLEGKESLGTGSGIALPTGGRALDVGPRPRRPGCPTKTGPTHHTNPHQHRARHRCTIAARAWTRPESSPRP